MRHRNLSNLSKPLATAGSVFLVIAVPVSAIAQTSATTAAPPMVVMVPASANVAPMVVHQSSPVVVTPLQVIAAPVTTELPAATAITVTPMSEISTKKLAVGDRIELMTNKAIVRGDRVFIPANAKVTAIVTEAVGGRAFGRGGQMAMRFETVQMPNGTTLELTGTHIETGARGNGQAAENLGRTGAALAGSFGAVGALAGLFARAAMTGASATIKPGATLVAHTGKPLLWNADNSVTVVSVGDANTTSGQPPMTIALPPKVALN